MYKMKVGKKFLFLSNYKCIYFIVRKNCITVSCPALMPHAEVG